MSDALSEHSTGEPRASQEHADGPAGRRHVPDAHACVRRATPCRRVCGRQCHPADFLKSPYLVLKNIYLHLSSKRSLPSKGAASSRASVASIFGPSCFVPVSCVEEPRLRERSGLPEAEKPRGRAPRPQRPGVAASPAARVAGRGPVRPPAAPGVGRSHSFLSLQCSSDLGSR